MKLHIIIVFALLSSYCVRAQRSVEAIDDRVLETNMVKWNPVSLAWGMGALSYDRVIAEHWTVGVTLNYRPKQKAAFKSGLQSVFERENKNTWATFDAEQLEYSNLSLVPEVRFYVGEQGVFKGFYIAAFAKIEKTKVEYTYRFDELFLLGRDPELPLKGDVNAFSGGVYVGVQWHLGHNVYLDWQIAGGNYGLAKLDLVAERDLSKEEQVQLEHFTKDIVSNFDTLEYKVDDDGARLNGRIPWMGLRMGVSLGYRF